MASAKFYQTIIKLSDVTDKALTVKSTHDLYLKRKYFDAVDQFKQIVESDLTSSIKVRRDLENFITKTTTGKSRRAVDDSIFYLDKERTHQTKFHLSDKGYSKVNQLFFKKNSDLVRDTQNNYYKSLDKGNIDSFIYKTFKGNLESFGRGISSTEGNRLKKRLSVFSFRNQKERLLDEHGNQYAITASERKLLRLNNTIARVLSKLPQVFTAKIMAKLLNGLFDIMMPIKDRTAYGKPKELGYKNYNLSNTGHRDIFNDIKKMANYGRGVLPKVTEDLTSKQLEDLNKSLIKSGLDSTDLSGLLARGGDMFFYKYDMSYRMHFTWLQERNVPFDICDVYSGQFCVSHESHPYLKYKHREVKDTMYEWGGELIHGRYMDEARKYIKTEPKVMYKKYKDKLDKPLAPGKRTRSFSSLNYPRDESPKFPLPITMPLLVANLVLQGGTLLRGEGGVTYFKNIYREVDLPVDHPSGWCAVTVVSFSGLLNWLGIKIEGAVPKEELMQLARERVTKLLSLGITNYMFQTKLGARSLEERMITLLEKKILALEKTVGIRTAVTIDKKRKLEVERLSIGPRKNDIEEAMIIMQQDNLKVLSKNAKKTSIYKGRQDTINIWYNDRMFRYKRHPVTGKYMLDKKGRKIIDTRVVSTRKHSYYYPKTGEFSGIGDVIIHSKNIEYWMAKGIPIDAIDMQIADAFGHQMFKHGGVHKVGRATQSKLIKNFSDELIELSDDVIKRNPYLKRLKKRWILRDTTYMDQLDMIGGLLIKDKETFKKLFKGTLGMLEDYIKDSLSYEWLAFLF